MPLFTSEINISSCCVAADSVHTNSLHAGQNGTHRSAVPPDEHEKVELPSWTKNLHIEKYSENEIVVTVYGITKNSSGEAEKRAITPGIILPSTALGLLHQDSNPMDLMWGLSENEAVRMKFEDPMYDGINVTTLSRIESNRYPILDHLQTTILVLRQKAGDPAAEERLVFSHMRLVRKMANRYWNNSSREIPFDDLFQEGNLGLIQGIRGYKYPRSESEGVEVIDWEKTARLSTIVSYWIKRNMLNYINDNILHFKLPRDFYWFMVRVVLRLVRFYEENERGLGDRTLRDAIAESLLGERTNGTNNSRSPVGGRSPGSIEKRVTDALLLLEFRGVELDQELSSQDNRDGASVNNWYDVVQDPKVPDPLDCLIQREDWELILGLLEAVRDLGNGKYFETFLYAFGLNEDSLNGAPPKTGEIAQHLGITSSAVYWRMGHKVRPVIEEYGRLVREREREP